MWQAFDLVLRRRRSVRRFTPQPIAEQDMRDVLEAGVLAPNSSNLQPFDLYWVRSPERKAALVKACLSQSAARKATELVVCVARWDQWDDTRAEYLAFLQREPNSVPKPVMLYYTSLSRGLYSLGPLGLAGKARRLGAKLAGLTRAVPRAPYDREDMRVWAVKSASLCCENMMLAAAAKGFDSCPMEGNDPLCVADVVGLSRAQWKQTWDVPMVLAFGFRDPEGGVWGTQWRRSREKLVHEI
jgi:nitroreductase